MKKTICSGALLVGTVFGGWDDASAQEAPPPAPPAPVPPPAPPAPVPLHTVAPGDTLWTISAARLGSSERWVEIYALNRAILESPDVIEVGQVLRIPSAPVEVPPALLATPSRAAAPGRSSVTASRPAAPSRSRDAVGRSASTRSNTSTAPVRRSPRATGGGDLATIRRCESGGNYQAVSASGKYRGAYQFDVRTWQSVGGSGDPAAASPAEQDARARQLRSQRGSSPWPNCG